MNATAPATRVAGLPQHLRLTALEELWGLPLGPHEQTPPLADDGPTGGVREELERAVLTALRRPPCLVSFSGGVDSSTVLALAAHAARREGLPAPVPVSFRFPGLEEAEETLYQESVIAHLRLEDWVRVEWDQELDVIGPVAQAVLARHGLLFPFNSFFHYPMLERAAGGALLTGIGGDELFTRAARGPLSRLLYQRRLPRVRELRRLAFELSPRPLRSRVDAFRDDYFEMFGWIAPDRRRELARLAADWQSRKPRRDDRAVRDWWWRSRMLQCGCASMRLLADDFDVLIEHPLANPDVLRAYANAGGATGLGGGSRRRGVEELLGDLLPHEVLQRRTKTTFDGAFWKGHARDFVAQWDGLGVDAGRVDVAALRAEWRKESPFPQSYILLQRAWLAGQAAQAQKSKGATAV
jgi:asparagine synthase (glutamine-hydrolysing)